MTEKLDEEQLAVLEKVEKLLRLAAKTPSQDEAASAAAKAQELLTAYNLSAESVGKHGKAADQRREKQAIKGGMYLYQRELWYKISELNFCLYWTIQHLVSEPKRFRLSDGTWSHYTKHKHEHRHTIVGKLINVRATIAMAQYVESAIERLVKERYPLNSQRFLREAVAYREGISDAVYWRLEDQRLEKLEKERRQQERDAKRKGVSTSNALTVGSLAEQEKDANEDFLHGEGYSARKRAKRAEQAEARRRAEEEYTRWAAANPEEARKQEEQQRKEREKRENQRRNRTYGRSMSTRDQRANSSEYWQGHDAGQKLALDPQVDKKEAPRRLG